MSWTDQLARARTFAAATRTTLSRALVDAAVDKALAIGGVVGTLLDDLAVLTRMGRAFVDGSYRSISPRTVVLVAAALSYFIMPLDLVPDMLVAVGYLDDTAVVAATIASIHADVQRFLEWERARA